MSIVPYNDKQRRRERQPLDRPQVVQAALALLDEVGLDGLTMRHLAERLGVKAASLYRHMRDKEELLILLADEISGEIPVVENDRPWQEQLVKLALGYRHVLLGHRDAARLLADTAPAGPSRLRHIEAALRLLLTAGFAPQDAMRAIYHFNNVVTEFVADEVRIATEAEAVGLSRGEFVAQARARLRALPVDEYPNVIRFADLVVEDDAEGLFRFGLELWISGLERLHPSKDSPGTFRNT
jgi:TetR/AcrR family tetracycline transcriptional repressor